MVVWVLVVELINNIYNLEDWFIYVIWDRDKLGVNFRCLVWVFGRVVLLFIEMGKIRFKDEEKLKIRVFFVIY